MIGQSLQSQSGNSQSRCLCVGEVLNGRILSPTFRPSPGLCRHLRIPKELSECGDPVPTGSLICGERRIADCG
eukprot:9857490-Alexandrium_andersonii.AAC.1